MEDYLESVNTVLKKLQTDTSGLTTKNASERLSEYGENSIKTDSSKSRIKTFFRQFRDLMIMVLVVSALLSRYLGEWRSAVILAIIVIFNAVV
jgi:magnesium-transporting ATPase (P-type)